MAVPDLANPAQNAGNRTTTGRLKMLMVLLICAAPVITSYLMYFFIKPGSRSNYGTLITPSRSLPAELRLQELDGRFVPAPSLRGQWLLVAVGPAACAGACEQRLYAQRQLREMLGRERERMDKVWLITDAEPLPAPLAQVVRAGPALTALRAERAALERWISPAPGQQIEDHLYLVDPMGEWMMRFPTNMDPARVKRDLDRVLRASASWDLAGR